MAAPDGVDRGRPAGACDKELCRPVDDDARYLEAIHRLTCGLLLAARLEDRRVHVEMVVPARREVFLVGTDEVLDPVGA